MSSFELTTTRIITVRDGWGVVCVPIWAGEESEGIAEVEVFVVPIIRDNCREIAGAWCVAADDNCWIPVEQFQELDELTQDDSHDFRTRWFATFVEATAHATSVRQRWANPAPWESFVALD